MPASGIDQEKARLEQELRIQRQVAFASGLFQGDVTVRTLLESLAEGVVIIDNSGTILLVNTRGEQMFGHQRKDLIGQPHAILIPERFRKVHEEHEAGYFKEPRIRPMGQLLDLTGLRQDGSEFPVEISLSFLETINGVLALAFVSDITERKRAEEALRFSEARYRTLYRDNPIMIATLDAGLTMRSVNPSCASQLGYTIDELEGQPVLKIFYEDDRPAVTEQLRRCLQNPNQVYRWQFRKVRKDGGLLWVEELAQAVYDLNGALNVLVVCQDITERKRAEEEIERLNADLAARAAELEAAYREMEAFNYTVAHDLRKPLTAISGFCQVLREVCGTRLDDQCKGYLQEVFDGTWRMNGLIDALLNFSHLAHVEPRREGVDLSAIAQEAVAELQLSEPARRVTFNIAERVRVQGDANLLRVVLDNLIGNAWKYTGSRDEGIIEFGIKEIEGMPVYFVGDNGTGFDMADADKLFVPFHRLPGAEESSGFGIGLATVERIVRRHGGRVWAEGESGRGATFYFTLGGDRTI